MTRLLFVFACLAVLVLVLMSMPEVADTTFTSPPGEYRVLVPIVVQPEWIDDPAKGIAGYTPNGASEVQRHHWQSQWGLTCSADEGVNCINTLKTLSVMDYLYDERPGLLTQTMQTCSGGEWWYGDEFNLYAEPREVISETHYIRGLFDQWAPEGCKFGFEAGLIGSGWWGRDAIDWLREFYALYENRYGESLEIDVAVVDDYYRGQKTYRESVEAHAAIRELFGQDTLIAAREFGCLAEWPEPFGCQKAALNYACTTGWHELYDRYLFFIGMGGKYWKNTELYSKQGITELGRWYAMFPSWYCGLQWEYWR